MIFLRSDSIIADSPAISMVSVAIRRRVGRNRGIVARNG